MNVKEDEKGYLNFIINGQSYTTHPQLTEFLETINEKHSQTKYFTYRCAGKIFEIQEFLQSSRIPYQLILGILDRHRLQNSTSITPAKMKQIVGDIYYAATKLGYFLESPTMDESQKYFLLNLIFNIFDPKRARSGVGVQELKQLMLILTESSCFQSKLYEYFDIVADHNQCIPRAKFEALLVNFARIFAFVDESANQFGTNWIALTLNDCYESCPGLGGLDNFQFLQLWSASGNFSNFSNILSLLQRLNEAQFVMHGKRCTGCDAFPIRGLRFKCQKCRSLSLCLKCFSTGFNNDRHSVGHKMFEISSNDRAAGSCQRFLASLCGGIKSHRMSSLENLEIKLVETDGNDPNSTNSVKISSHSTLKRTMNKSVVSNFQTMQRVPNRVLKICDALTEQNERFLNNIKALNLSQSQGGFLETHYQQLSDHIKELRETQGTNNLLPFSSTPFARTTRRRQPLPNLNISTPALLNSIQGAEINRSFIEENKSLSINDISNWFQHATSGGKEKSLWKDHTVVDTKMANFRKLLGQVKDIVDDSYSDNHVLAEKTKTLEQALDEIIVKEEERKSGKMEF